ncbi:MAG: glycosyltransferase [Bacteroidales bacterium]
MKEPKTILFYNTNRSWGGGEKWHFEMAEELFRRGYLVHVFAHPSGRLLERCISADIPVTGIATGRFSFLNPIHILLVKQKMLRLSVKTVILNLPADMKAGGMAAHKAGVGSILYRRGTALPVTPHRINRYFFSRILTGVIANSEATKALINQKRTLIAPEKIHVVYNGIKDIPTPEAKAGSGKLIIGNAGRMVYQKGQEFLLTLAGLLQTEINDFEIHIAGDGPLKGRLQSEIEKQGLSEKVKLKDFQTSLNAFYREIDIFVLPSRWEGFGYVMVEAMLHQKPVIAFDISSNPEIISNNKTGYLIPWGQLEKFKEKILYLWHHPQKRLEMGKCAYREASSRFTLQRSADQLQTIINSS